MILLTMAAVWILGMVGGYAITTNNPLLWLGVSIAAALTTKIGVKT